MGDIIPITTANLTGELRKRLSWQVAEERFNRAKRTAVVARHAAEVKKNSWKKNMRFMCEVPAREYFRIRQQVDPDFFRVHRNVKRYLIDEHPELKGGVGV